MALSVNRAEQRKLLNEMDKLGLPASEPVFEAIIAGHLFARDVTSSYEALIAGRREGFKLHQAHSHHVAAMVQTGAVDPAVRTCSSPPLDSTSQQPLPVPALIILPCSRFMPTSWRWRRKASSSSMTCSISSTPSSSGCAPHSASALMEVSYDS